MLGWRAGSTVSVYAQVQCLEPITGQQKVQFYWEDEIYCRSGYSLSMAVQYSLCTVQYRLRADLCLPGTVRQQIQNPSVKYSTVYVLYCIVYVLYSTACVLNCAYLGPSASSYRTHLYTVLFTYAVQYSLCTEYSFFMYCTVYFIYCTVQLMC